MAAQNNIPRVVFAGFASCFGCQINITNIEQHLVDVLGQIDLQYWQLTSSDPMPDSFDVAVIEGAITTEEARQRALALRQAATTVITIGACAASAGIPGLSKDDRTPAMQAVYGQTVPDVAGNGAIKPCAVADVIKVDYAVPCCPIDPYTFVEVLQHALHGSNAYPHTSTLCGECKNNERGCLYMQGKFCLGLVTREGCGARCPNLGRPCNGCAGLSPDANVAQAERVAERIGVSQADFKAALRLFNPESALSAEQ